MASVRTVMQPWPHVISCHFEDRFWASKKGGIGGGGRVSAQGAVHIAALAGCRKALVSTSLAISLLDTNGRR